MIKIYLCGPSVRIKNGKIINSDSIHLKCSLLQIENYDHRDGSVSKINGIIDEKANSVETTNEYFEENGVQQISIMSKVN